jgi:hypothetical protein
VLDLDPVGRNAGIDRLAADDVGGSDQVIGLADHRCHARP